MEVFLTSIALIVAAGAIFLLLLLVAGVVLVATGRVWLGLLCILCFGVFAVQSAMDWQKGDETTHAFGAPHEIASIQQGWPIAVSDLHSMECGRVCRAILLSGERSQVYATTRQRGRHQIAYEPVDAVFSLGSEMCVEAPTTVTGSATPIKRPVVSFAPLQGPRPSLSE